MPKTCWFILVGCCLPLMGGCALSSPPAQWVQEHGGLAAGPARDRLVLAAGPLVDRFGDHRARLGVLDSPNPGAYAWPGGRIYVTRGLIEMLADDELAAAVAHELGHLLSSGNMPAPASIRGCAREKARDEESRADALGAELLRLSGIDPRAMARMLARLSADPGLTDRCRANILDRMARISADATPRGRTP